MAGDTWDLSAFGFDNSSNLPATDVQTSVVDQPSGFDWSAINSAVGKGLDYFIAKDQYQTVQAAQAANPQYQGAWLKDPATGVVYPVSGAKPPVAASAGGMKMSSILILAAVAVGVFFLAEKH